MAHPNKDQRATVITPAGGTNVAVNVDYSGWASAWFEVRESEFVRLLMTVTKGSASHISLRVEFDDADPATPNPATGYRTFRPAPADSQPFPDDLLFTLAGFSAVADKVTWLVACRGAGKMRVKALAVGAVADLAMSVVQDG